MTDKFSKEEIRKLAESDLNVFAALVNPNRLYGDIHREWMEWSTHPKRKNNQLTLIPRAHGKSHQAAVRAAWDITRNPAVTILYVSATSSLAEKQLFAIKNILDSPVYRRYWPNMIHKDKGKREMWNNREISVDHPTRKEEGVRDSTVFAAGLTTNITGFHADKVYLDDIVVPANAYTEEGRASVRRMYSQLASIENTGAEEIAVGTRYHPDDIYSSMMEITIPVADEYGNILKEDNLYDKFERVVEVDGDFLWPKEYRKDGKAFGFDWKELAIKKAQYLDKVQFYAQYYQQPNSEESNRLTQNNFQYFNPDFLTNEKQIWKYKGKKLKIYAAADLAFTMHQKSDYTAIVVIGIDADGYIYVLDATRFKTDKYDQYYERIVELHNKWRFSKIRIETNAGGTLVAGYLRDEVRRNGQSLIIDEKASTRAQGSKEERIAAVLEPRYDNHTIFHHKGGMINILENELILARPKNDDLKDALAAAVSIAKPPAKVTEEDTMSSKVVTHSRFGGVVI